MDVIAIPGIGLRGRRPGKDILRLAPELEAYRCKSPEGARRLVGVAFDQESWRNPKTAAALLRLCKELRAAGALVFVAIIPPGYQQNGIAGFFAKHCIQGNVLDFTAILDLLNRSVLVVPDYEISFPTPDVSCRLKSLAEQVQAFSELQEKLKDKPFSGLPTGLLDQVVWELGRFVSDEKSADSYLEQFRGLSLEDQTAQWADWMAQNPCQTKLDCELNAFIPLAFRDRGSIPARFCFEDAVNNHPPPEG